MSWEYEQRARASAARAKPKSRIFTAPSGGHCQLGRKRNVFFRNGRLSWSRLRPLSLSARPQRIVIARVGDSPILASGVLLEKDSGPHRGATQTVALGQQI